MTKQELWDAMIRISLLQRTDAEGHYTIPGFGGYIIICNTKQVIIDITNKTTIKTKKGEALSYQNKTVPT